MTEPSPYRTLGTQQGVAAEIWTDCSLLSPPFFFHLRGEVSPVTLPYVLPEFSYCPSNFQDTQLGHWRSSIPATALLTLQRAFPVEQLVVFTHFPRVHSNLIFKGALFVVQKLESASMVVFVFAWKIICSVPLFHLIDLESLSTLVAGDWIFVLCQSHIEFHYMKGYII